VSGNGRHYVGVTSEEPFIRHQRRVNSACNPNLDAKELASFNPFERHLRKIGSTAALHDYYVIILEQRDLPSRLRRKLASSLGHSPGPEELATEWKAFIAPFEKFWIATLHSSLQMRGWNVEHAPQGLRRLPSGRYTSAYPHGVGRPSNFGTFPPPKGSLSR